MRTLFAWWLMVCALACSLLVTSAAGAGELTLTRALFEDTSGSLGIAEVVQREFAPVGPSMNKGVSDSAYWLRLTVKPPPRGDKVVLLIRQPFLNEVRLYEAGNGDPADWKTRVTGDLYPYAERERASHTLGFVVDVAGPEATFYLRMKTRVWSEIAIEALPPDEADRLDSRFDVLATLFVSAMALMLIWAVQSYFLDRLPVIGYFALHQAAYLWYGTTVTGYLAQWMPSSPPWLVELSLVIPYCAVSITPVLLSRELFKAYQPPAPVMRGLDLMLLAAPLQLAAIAMDRLQLAAGISALLIRISWPYFVFATFLLRREQSPSRRTLQACFAAMTAALMAFWIARISLPSDSHSYLYGRHMLIANGLLIGVLFCLVINARIRRIFQEAQQSAVQLALARQTLEVERRLKQEAETQARTDYLTGLFNRRHFMALAEQELERIHRYPHSLSLLMIDIDHFKAVNDLWGHGVGDRVLQSVALQIQDTLRSSDICARTGGEEFVAVVLETDEEGAVEVAERIRLAVAQKVIVPKEGYTLQVTVSIGLVTVRGQRSGLLALMNEADLLLYRAKQLGRNKVVVADRGEA